MNRALVAVILLVLAPRIAADEDICGKVECGMGTCKYPASNVAGYWCKCQPGWTQLHFGNNLRFLPCNIPDCDFRVACHDDSLDHLPLFPNNSASFNIFDPCFWSYCGGGKCEHTSTFGHDCRCKEGFGNLLNISSFPCIKECALGANCTNLGISLTNSTQPMPNDDANCAEGPIHPRRLLRQVLVLATILAAGQAL